MTLSDPGPALTLTLTGLIDQQFPEQTPESWKRLPPQEATWALITLPQSLQALPGNKAGLEPIRCASGQFAETLEALGRWVMVWVRACAIP